MSSQDPQTLVEEGQQAPTYQNPAALELTEEELQLWRRHPVTQCFLLFLAHRSQDLKKAAAEYYIAGTIEEAEKGGMRGRIMELEELCVLKSNDIHRFYGKEPEAKKPVSKS